MINAKLTLRLNSAVMRFIPAEQMAAAGYEQYVPLLDHRDARRKP
jgi:hypothetical protein